MSFIVKIVTGQKPSNKKVNVNGSDDPCYRYQMKQLHVQVIGYGKMIKSHFLNLEEVAKDLKIPPIIIIAFLGYELNTKYDYKPKNNICYIVGDPSDEMWNIKFKKFLDDVLICPKCNLPELIMNKDLKSNCSSCGEEVTHKLNAKFKNFLIKF